MSFWDTVCALAFGIFAADLLNWVFRNVVSYFTYRWLRRKAEQLLKDSPLGVLGKAQVKANQFGYIPEQDEPPTIN